MTQLPVQLTGQPEGDQFVQMVNKILGEERERRTKQYGVKSWGNFGVWQMDKIYHLQELPLKHYDRFNLFLAETAPEIEPGTYHLHAYYDKTRKVTYWEPTKARSRVCKVPGRCRIVQIGEPDEQA